MSMSRFLVFIICLLSIPSFGQNYDSVRTVELADVVIVSDMLKTAEVGLSEDRYDSLRIETVNGLTLADLFRITAGGQIRSYGSNGLTTASFRGTGGNHTAVLWNGINLQSPLSGSQDLSLIPVTFIDDLSVQKGGSSSIYGSGAIGGTIQLQNQPHFGRWLSLSTTQQLGSFGHYFQSYQGSYGSDRFYSSTTVFARTIDNDYPYTNTYERPPVVENRSNAGSDQWGILQQNDWRIGEHNLLGIRAWYQNNELEVPASIIASDDSLAVQNDEFLRGILSWSHCRESHTLEYKSSVNLHNLTFNSSSTSNAQNNFLTWTNRLVSTQNFGNQSSLLLGINHNHNRATVDAFRPEAIVQNITALFASLQLGTSSGRFKSALNLRQELVDGAFIPFTPSLGLEWHVLQPLTLRSSLSRNYRIPTLNELYWRGSGAQGNPDLKAEDSYNAEAGIDWKMISYEVWSLTASGTVYYSLVDNWVQWQEKVVIDGQPPLWTPVNLKTVLSRGFEGKITSDFLFGKFQGSLTGQYSYTRTTNKEVADDVNPNILDKQLPYTPLHDASVFASAQCQNITLTVDHTYTSKQYTEAENRARFALDGYQITNVYLGYQKNWNKINTALGFRVNNLMDTNYENRRGYPMYGRNYLIELKISFNNNQ